MNRKGRCQAIFREEFATFAYYCRYNTLKFIIIPMRYNMGVCNARVEAAVERKSFGATTFCYTSRGRTFQSFNRTYP